MASTSVSCRARPVPIERPLQGAGDDVLIGEDRAGILETQFSLVS